MNMCSEKTDELFETIASSFTEPSDHLLEVVDSFRPVDPSMLDWRFSLLGFVKGLEVSGTMDSELVECIRRELFGPPQTQNNRKGRDFRYSIDVHSRDESSAANLARFDVAAMNTLDAYAQLSKRIAYRSIPEVFKIEVFVEFAEKRKEIQLPVRRFEASELIYINDLASA